MKDTQKKEAKILQCPNPNCKYKWEYNGSADFYTSCPRCKSSVRVRGAKDE